MAEDGAQPPDEELAARCQKGDFAAFEILYRRWQRPILAYLYQITRDYDAAGCVAQDVFMRVFEHFDRFDLSRRFSTWFYTIARNAAIDWLQSRHRKVMVSFTDLDKEEEGEQVPISAVAPAVPIEQALARSESNRIIAESLAELPQIYREIIELVIFQDLSYEQASEILGGVSVGTLRSRMFHALRRLRVRLEQVGGTGGEHLI